MILLARKPSVERAVVPTDISSLRELGQWGPLYQLSLHVVTERWILSP